jgi:hypothetical protein
MFLNKIFNMDLYDLPKDMLVKLVATIREDSHKDLKAEKKKLKRKLKEVIELGNIGIYKCSGNKCESTYMFTHRYHEKSREFENFKNCDLCNEDYCSKHIFKIEEGNICESCKDEEYKLLSFTNLLNIFE